MDEIALKYGVGPLLYCPALNTKITKEIVQGELGRKYSVALCLEDTIAPEQVESAEQQVKAVFSELSEAKGSKQFYMPKMFVRVREPEQIERVYGLIHGCEEILTGFIFPKYSVGNADKYNDVLARINTQADKKVYMMPILESEDLIDVCSRPTSLGIIKRKIDDMAPYVLNIRVGGNDFSNAFSTRRHCNETIYDIGPIAQLFADILAVFSREYVVSGPVWEYFSGKDDGWKCGLQREIKLDLLNGFVGKTVIHPNQIGVVLEMLQVDKNDYEDAKAILKWDKDALQVGKSTQGDRMNEVRTHGNWANKIVTLAELYGVK